MIILALIVLCAVLYWIGGERWAHTLFRDLGCGVCITAIAWLLLGFSWPLLAIIPLVWGGCSIGDHDEQHWAMHAFVIGLCMLPYAAVSHAYLAFGLMIFAITSGTYFTSRYFSNGFMADVWCRGVLYGTIPLWFLIK